MAGTAEPVEPSTLKFETKPRTAPETNDELGVLGAQAAREQERHERMKDREGVKSPGEPRYDHTRDPHLRLEVLRLAQEAPSGATVSADDVVKRATTYIAFIKGESSV